MRRLCLEPRCPNDATYRGRCRTHTRQHARATASNRHVYDKRKWKRTRRAYLAEKDYECERCGRMANEVHHKQALQDGGNPWSMDNLEALCQPCHSQETRREQGAIHGST